MSKSIRVLAVLASAGFLAACNQYTDFERAAMGAAIGCAAGEIIDNNCVVGGFAGAAAGAMSDNI